MPPKRMEMASVCRKAKEPSLLSHRGGRGYRSPGRAGLPECSRPAGDRVEGAVGIDHHAQGTKPDEQVEGYPTGPVRGEDRENGQGQPAGQGGLHRAGHQAACGLRGRLGARTRLA